MNMDVQYNTLLSPAVKGLERKGLETKEVQALFVKSVDIEKRQVRVLASSSDLDRDDEKILPSAFKKRLNIYKSNPVILAGHSNRLSDGNPPVIGKAVEIWIDKRGLWVIIEFAKTELAEQYWQLYRDGYMKAVSVGFIIVPDGSHEEFENGKRIRVFDEVELIEISCVAVPSNRQALTRSKQKKQDFIARKIAEQEEKSILDELRAEDPNFDDKSAEFAAAMCGYKIVDGQLIESDEFGIIEDDFDEVNFGDIELSGDKSDYARLITEGLECAGFINQENEYTKLIRG